MKPIHPLLVHFPIALLLLSVAADLVAFFTDVQSLRDTAWWALLGAAVGGAFTVLAGLYDMRRADLTEEVHVRVHTHMKVGLTLLAALIGLTLWRLKIYTSPDPAPGWGYLAAALFAVGLTALQGWLGGELVYTYGVFDRPAGRNDKSAGTPHEHHSHTKTKHDEAKDSKH